MPIRKEDYPDNWKELSLQVRTEADWKCEWCTAQDYQVIKRRQHGSFSYVPEVYEEATMQWERTEYMPWHRLKFHGLTRIILTTAHLDRNSKNNERSNLAALCQRCHLHHDIRQHLANRKFGRHHNREHQYKLPLYAET